MSSIFTSPKFNSNRKWSSSISSSSSPNSENWDFSRNLINILSNLPPNPILQQFDLSNNLIESISPDSLNKYSSLTHLNLSTNLLTKIQNLEIPSLKLLDLSNNRISVLENIENMDRLESLNLSSNRIHSVFLIGSLQFLATLDLSYNPINSFAYHEQFPRLTTLSLDYCFLDSFLSISKFSNLRRLSLAHNKIIEDIVLELPYLEYLNVSYNKITSLESFVHLTSLKTLDLSYNSITDSSFSTEFTLNNLHTLNVSGTLITTPLSLLSVFPNVQNCEFSNTLITNFQYIIEFIQKCSTLTSLDLRNMPFTQNLYFDNDNYQSIEEYDRKYPKNASERREYRNSILRVQKLTVLDGITTVSEIAALNNDPNEIEFLRKLLDEQNELRKILGLSGLSSFINELDPEERRAYIERLTFENQKLRQKAAERNVNSSQVLRAEKQRKAAKQDELDQLILQNKELHKKLHHSYFTEFNETDIDKLISLYKKANEELKREVELHKTTIIFKKKRRSREHVIELCQKALFQIARTKISHRKSTMALSESSEEFLYLEGWISAKMFTKIKLQSVIKNIVFEQMLEREKTMQWMTLAVDTGMNSMEVFQQGVDRPIVIADHMNHLEAKVKKAKEAIFLICAFDNGKVIVDLDHKSQLPDVSSFVGKYDSLLFHWKHNQYFYAITPERVLPLYIVHIRLSESDI
ncbi:hypothetical protein TRFO_07625 [Tritrichomonas foetus]|uniref:Leucine Rich Repeat family protein n=1 Tax=Tritrichomonas foetus TaxID=1144522 RepID=A0A1J4JVR7_9EUKA|nr:hypothetical protein TRFO_07625 [Tritrichomonas foetus]|eukprot:OHT01373.1 hypothetical protein TRFO_07625 [Tritrichomonas foetus]